MQTRSLLDPKFKYTDHLHTDIRKTFAKARREMASASKSNTAKRSDRQK